MTYHKVDEGNYFITENDSIPPKFPTYRNLCVSWFWTLDSLNFFRMQNEGEKTLNFNFSCKIIPFSIFDAEP